MRNQNMKQYIVLLAIVGLTSADGPVNQAYNQQNQAYNPQNQPYNQPNQPYNQQNQAYNQQNQPYNNYNANNAYPAGNNYPGAPAPIFPNPNNNVPILRLENNNNGEAGYSYLYETGDGTSAQEQGYLKAPDAPTAQGGFAFTAPDGQQFSVSYTADENGFQPQGAHLPTPPPIPEEILKALEQNSADEARGIVDDGQYRPEPSPHQQFASQQHLPLPQLGQLPQQQQQSQQQQQQQQPQQQQQGVKAGYPY